MTNIRDMSELIDPGFIDEDGILPLGGGVIIHSGQLVINSIGPVEIPLRDGSVGIFDSNGDFIGLK